MKISRSKAMVSTSLFAACVPFSTCVPFAACVWAAVLLGGCSTQPEEPGGNATASARVRSSGNLPHDKGKVRLITAATPRPQSQKLHIALIASDAAHPLLPALRNGALQAAQQMRWVQLTILTPTSAAPQSRLLQKALDQHVDGILLWPASQSITSQNAAPLQAVVAKASKAKVPVVTLQDDLPGSQRATYCGVDEVALGAAAGREAIALLAPKGKLAILAGEEKDASQQERLRGVRQSLKTASKVRPVGVFYCDGDTSRALQVMARVTKAQKPDGWIVLGNWPLLSDKGLGAAVPKSVKIVAMNPLPATWRSIENQRVQVCLGQKPFTWGQEGMKLLVKAIDGQKLPTSIDVGFERVTPETLPAYKSLWQRTNTAPKRVVAKAASARSTAKIPHPKPNTTANTKANTKVGVRP